MHTPALPALLTICCSNLLLPADSFSESGESRKSVWRPFKLEKPPCFQRTSDSDRLSLRAPQSYSHNRLQTHFPAPSRTISQTTLLDKVSPEDGGFNQPTNQPIIQKQRLLRQALEESGCALLDIESVGKWDDFFPTWMQVVRDTQGEPFSKRAPYNDICLSWQKQYLIDDVTDHGVQWSISPWMAVRVKNCDLISIRSIAENKKMFEIADSYFSQLNRIVKPLFPEEQYSILEEIRYIDPMGNCLRGDAGWHCDNPPVHVTAVCTLSGAGTCYSAEIDASQLDESRVVDLDSDFNVDEVPLKRTLLFFGKASGAKPLYHKSPLADQPRLLFLYRLLKAGEESIIRESPS